MGRETKNPGKKTHFALGLTVVLKNPHGCVNRKILSEGDFSFCPILPPAPPASAGF